MKRDALMFRIRQSDGLFEVKCFDESVVEEQSHEGWVFMISVSELLNDHIQDTRLDDERGHR